MDRTEVDFEALRSFSLKFRQECEEIDHQRVKTRRMVDALADQGWQGSAAEGFLDEMYELILPAMHRLSDGLSEAALRAGKIAEIFLQAQKEAEQNLELITWSADPRSPEHE